VSVFRGRPHKHSRDMKRVFAPFALAATALLTSAQPSLAQYYNYNSYGSGNYRYYSGNSGSQSFSGSTYTSPSGRWGSYSGFSRGRSYGGTCWRLGNSVSCSGY